MIEERHSNARRYASQDVISKHTRNPINYNIDNEIQDSSKHEYFDNVKRSNYSRSKYKSEHS